MLIFRQQVFYGEDGRPRRFGFGLLLQLLPQLVLEGNCVDLDLDRLVFEQGFFDDDALWGDGDPVTTAEMPNPAQFGHAQ